MKRSTLFVLTSATLFIFLIQVSLLRAQGDAGDSAESVSSKTKNSKAKTTDQDEIRKLRERIEKLEKAISRLKGNGNKINVDPKNRKILVMMENPYVGRSYYGSKQTRYFVAKLIFMNLTPDTTTVKRDEIQLSFDGKTYKQTDLPSQLRYQSFSVGSQSYSLRNLARPLNVRIPSNKMASTWVIFTGLPTGNEIPTTKINMTLAGTKQTIDVIEHEMGLLDLKIERIGPHGSLGLFTISGTLNSINASGLVNAIDKLVGKKVARFVIRWTKSAPRLDSNVYSWLSSSANNAGRGSTTRYSGFPVFPASVRELHLAQVPYGSSSSSTSTPSIPFTTISSTQRIHKTDVNAVMYALKSAYESIPRDELIHDIEKGHALTRAAALAGGGGRLPAEKLPLLLKYTDDKDPVVQQAALLALRHFGEKSAVDKLVHYAKKNAPKTGDVAVYSLASSRYATAHQALLDILKNEPPQSRLKIVKILAKHPRPIWSETIYGFVNNPNSGMGVEALQALGVIGHPKLTDLLQKILKTGNSTFKQEAFRQLARKTDSESERIAMEYTLERMKTSAPTSEMYSLIRRTKDPRSIPLLFAQLSKSSGSRSQIINILGEIGDETVGEKLVAFYPKVKSEYEKSYILRALIRLKSPKFRQLAGEALLTRNSSLISTACEGLRADGSKEAVKLMINALEKSTYSSTWSYTCNALSEIGTPEARKALQKARDSSNSSKRSYALSALRNMMYRSPGYQYIYQAKSSSRQNQPKKAVEYYSLALKLDPELAIALSGRGHSYLKLKKYKDAKADFTKAMKLDPYDSLAITGLGVVLAIEGKCEEGIKKIEENRSKFKSNNLYLYNAACVYGRALEYVQNNKNTPDREKKLIQYRDKALADLRQAVKYGFRNYEQMKKDPDFASLKDLPEFKKIHTPTTAKKKTAESLKKSAPPIAPPKAAVETSKE